MSENANPLDGIKFEAQNLYREEMYTDLKTGTIRRLVPVKPDGADDSSRTALYTGETQILTQAGPVPVNAQLEANTLQEAMDVFPEAMKNAVEQLMEEVREMQRKEASKIVVPKTGPGGKIELP